MFNQGERLLNNGTSVSSARIIGNTGDIFKSVITCEGHNNDWEYNCLRRPSE